MISAMLPSEARPSDAIVTTHLCPAARSRRSSSLTAHITYSMHLQSHQHWLHTCPFSSTSSFPPPMTDLTQCALAHSSIPRAHTCDTCSHRGVLPVGSVSTIFWTAASSISGSPIPHRTTWMWLPPSVLGGLSSRNSVGAPAACLGELDLEQGPQISQLRHHNFARTEIRG